MGERDREMGSLGLQLWIALTLSILAAAVPPQYAGAFGREAVHLLEAQEGRLEGKSTQMQEQLKGLRSVKQTDQSELEDAIRTAAKAKFDSPHSITKLNYIHHTQDALVEARAKVHKNMLKLAALQTKRGLTAESQAKLKARIRRKKAKVLEQATQAIDMKERKDSAAEAAAKRTNEIDTKKVNRQQLLAKTQKIIYARMMEKRTKHAQQRQTMRATAKIQHEEKTQAEKYIQFNSKYSSALKGANIHERSEKHRINGPEMKETAHKGELHQKGKELAQKKHRRKVASYGHSTQREKALIAASNRSEKSLVEQSLSILNSGGDHDNTRNTV